MRPYISVLPAALVAVAIVSAQQPATQQGSASQSGATQSGAGQQPAVTFRTETNFVEVHAIVTDQKGAFVKDLTREDFEVYEDGRLQAPSVFSLVDVPLEKPFIPLNATAPIEPDVRETVRTFDGRIYILLLDDLHTNVTRTNNVREVARRFISERVLLPSRLTTMTPLTRVTSGMASDTTEVGGVSITTSS